MTRAQMEAAIAAEDWERALPAALDTWRGERSVELADLIDRITERCAKPKPPHTRAATHRWWMANAVAPDPMMVGALLEAFPIRLYVHDAAWDTIRARWGSNPVIDGVAALPPPRYWARWRVQQGLSTEWTPNVANWVDRVAAMYTWPDDPRVARALATMLCDTVAVLEGDPGEGPWPAIAERLIALGDRRVGEVVGQVTDPNRLTSRQRAIHAVREAFPVPAVPASPASPPVDRQLRALWDEVGANVDDDAPRLVLADALLARGDNRGELIALQCARSTDNASRADVQAGRLIKREWERWLGPLALLLARRGSEMRRGMLERIRVGINATPPWAWEAVAGHHELVAVREVRPAMAPPHAFARLVAALPHFPRLLELDAPEALVPLFETPAPGLEHVHYAPISNLVYFGRERPPIEQIYQMLAKLAPNLRQLDLGPQWWHGGKFRTLGQIEPSYFGELLAMIRALFPRLARIRIMESSVLPEARASLRERAGVELIAKFEL